MTKHPSQLRPLYARLKEAGINQTFVTRHVLPSWWTSQVAKEPGGYLLTLGYIAKHLGVDVRVLQDEDAPIDVQQAASTRFKKRAGVDEEDLTWAKQLGIRAAHLAARATPQAYEPPRLSALELHARVTQEEETPWVDSRSLLRYAWSVGIPVLHLSVFPKVQGFSSKKPEGMAIMVGERPVIVLLGKHKHDAKQAFVLAHELGHIACGHLRPDEVETDDALDFETRDEQEQEANAFAATLLTGHEGAAFSLDLGHWPKADHFAALASESADFYNVLPGAIVLNWGWSEGRTGERVPWPLITATLKKLEPEADAPGTIRQFMQEHLDFELLPEESAAFLRRISGLGE